MIQFDTFYIHSNVSCFFFNPYMLKKSTSLYKSLSKTVKKNIQRIYFILLEYTFNQMGFCENLKYIAIKNQTRIILFKCENVARMLI